ncbi:enoyl-CoA hydratase/isomerase family protein [Rhodococcoides fascians A25f]|uniref:enoyl-CoA hydratase/isomerase family protein n=1 Tax=Rhodococcoides fascians TaxID=1828 RepID=UPI00068C3160|nr:enoyl-CoA hydratase/isomerase family protein [Rhodococcus fascians]QII07296.1 enoyl-CoA hydratase/isomerase family protein [Rhodococcus fascians A25f]
MRTVSIARLAAADLDPVSPDDVVSFVDLTERADTETVSAAAQRARRSHRILIGIGSPSENLEVLGESLSFSIDDGPAEGFRSVRVSGVEREVAQIADSVRAAPLASMTCNGLLRMAQTLDVHSALVAESMAYSTLQSGPEFRGWLAGRRSCRGSSACSTVQVSRDNDRLTIELDRPEVHNAIDAGMRDQLVEALQLALVDDTIDEVVLSGRGKSFSSGGDLTEFGSTPDPATAHLIRTEHRPGEQIYRLAERLGTRCVAHVHGAVIGGGLELAAFAGLVVADSNAVFALPEVSMGLVPGAGGTVSVSRRIGRWRSAWLMLTGNRIDAATAERWNLVDRIHTGSPAI